MLTWLDLEMQSDEGENEALSVSSKTIRADSLSSLGQDSKTLSALPRLSFH